VNCNSVSLAVQVAEEAVEQLAEAQQQAAAAVDEAAQLRGRLATAQQQIKARPLRTSLVSSKVWVGRVHSPSHCAYSASWGLPRGLLTHFTSHVK